MLLAGIEQLAFVRGLKASFVAYPIVNALHIMSIGALLTSVMLMDLRIVGAFRSLPQAPFVALLRRTAFVAFAGALVTWFAALFGQGEPSIAAMPIFLSQNGAHPRRRREYSSAFRTPLACEKRSGSSPADLRAGRWRSSLYPSCFREGLHRLFSRLGNSGRQD